MYLQWIIEETSDMATRLFWIVLVYTTMVVDSSHFRGGIIQWHPSDPSNYNGQVTCQNKIGDHNFTIIIILSQIEIHHRIAWRRSFSNNNYYCDATTISSSALLGGTETSLCRVGCSGTLASLKYHCTDYSTTDDWSSGEKTSIYDMRSVTYFEAS